MFAINWRSWVPYVVSFVALMPAMWVLCRPFRAPADPAPTGRVRGPEANLWGRTPHAVTRFEFLVNGAADRRLTRRGTLRMVSQNREVVTYHVTNQDDVCLQLVEEARIELDEQCSAFLARFGGRVVSVNRDLANVQEFYLPVMPRPNSWSLTGRSMGGVTTGTTQWRVLTPSLQGSVRATIGALDTYAPTLSLSEVSPTAEQQDSTLVAQELGDHQVDLTIFLGDEDRVDSVSAPLRYERGFAKALRIDGSAVASVDLTVTDLTLVGARERLLFVAGIGFGLAASILATLLVEWSKR